MLRQRNGGGRWAQIVGLLSALWLLAGARVGATIYYVSPSGNNANAGTSWITATATVQAAMNLAFPGDQIWVEAGAYANSQITMANGVALYGGFNGTETQLGQRNYAQNVTLLDGGGGAYVVATGNSNRIDGFTLQNATNDIQVVGSTVIANNNIIESATGILLHNSYTAFVNITGNTIEGNSACGILGPAAILQITGNTITGNGSQNDAEGGININMSPNSLFASPICTIVANTISRNVGSGLSILDGGGSSSSPSLVARNVISQNGLFDNVSEGGGLFIEVGQARYYTFKDNLIADNAAYYGAGISMYLIGNANITFANNTIVGNLAGFPGYGGGIGFLTWVNGSVVNLANNIVAFNSSGIDAVAYGEGVPVVTPTLTTNDVYGNTWDNYSLVSPGATDLSADPLFVDLDNNNYHESSVSPCIDAGTNSFVSTGDTDLDGNPRINLSGQVDIGAYEWTTSSTFPDLQQFSISPAVLFTGQSASGQVILTGPAPAPGVTVALTSSAPGIAGVPTSVVVPTGASMGFFTVTAAAVASPMNTTISASYRGITRSSTLTVTPLLASIALSLPAVAGAGTVNGTITFNGPAPAGTSLTLNSSDPSVTVPSPLNVPTGATSVNFTATTSTVSAPILVTLSASFGPQTLSAYLIEDPPATLKTLTVAPTTVTGGFNSVGVVTLTAAAPADGIEIPISSSNLSVAAAPAFVTVPAGKRSVSFPIRTVPVTIKSSVTLSATLGAVTKTAVLTVVPNTIASLTLLPNMVEGGTENSIGIITLTMPATAPLTVKLAGKGPASPDVTTLTIPTGALGGTFGISTNTVASTTTATITATLFGVAKPATLTVTP